MCMKEVRIEPLFLFVDSIRLKNAGVEENDSESVLVRASKGKCKVNDF